jgi:hypothetical protein
MMEAERARAIMQGWPDMGTSRIARGYENQHGGAEMDEWPMERQRRGLPLRSA